MRHQILAGLWITLSAIGCELATEFDRNKIGRDASVDASDDAARSRTTADGSTFLVPGIKNRNEPDLGGTAEEWIEYEGCQLLDDIATPAYPFTSMAGHKVMTNPCQHAKRLAYVPRRGWDIACEFREQIGSLANCEVIEVVRNCPNCNAALNPTCCDYFADHDGDRIINADDRDLNSVGHNDDGDCWNQVRDPDPRSGSHDRRCGGGYGNHIKCETLDGLIYLVGHYAQDSIPAVIQVGCSLREGDLTGTCGNSGLVIPSRGGDGTHSHSTVYRVVDGVTIDAELNTPDTWTPVASLREPDCRRDPENCSNGADDNDDGRVDCEDVQCVNNPVCTPHITRFSCSSTRRGDTGVVCDVYGDHFIAPLDHVWVRGALNVMPTFINSGHFQITLNWNCDAALGLVSVRYRHRGSSNAGECEAVYRACLDDALSLTNDCTGIVCARSTCDRMCNAGCPDPEPCMGVVCNDMNDCTSDSCVGGSCRYELVPSDCGARICGQSPSGCRVCGGCLARANATANCVGGSCSYSCVGSYANCDGGWANGCETHVSADPSNCGSCGNICPTRSNADTSCTAHTCGFACRGGWNNCDGNAANGCEHSGACMAPDPCVGISCNDGNDCTTDYCIGGTCHHDTVSPDCGARVCGAAPNGCGECGRCPDLANGSEVCSSGSCQIGSCFGNYRNCDGIPSNGCEQFVGNDVNNCGSCGNICPVPPHMVPTCIVGRCGRLCAAGWENCDGNPDNGCEHSGACPPPPPEEWCGNGVCGVGESDCPGSCPADCAPSCGDGCCTGGETCGSCASDCGVCPPPPPDGPVCRNGFCEMGEDCAACPDDCGACPPPPPPPGGCINDGVCNGGESCGTCPCDCCRACNPGQSDSQSCDPTPGVDDLCSFVHTRTCTASCAWGGWGECSGDRSRSQYAVTPELQCGSLYGDWRLCGQYLNISGIAQRIVGESRKSTGASFISNYAIVEAHRTAGGGLIAASSCYSINGFRAVPFPITFQIPDLELVNPGDQTRFYIQIRSRAGNCDGIGGDSVYSTGHFTAQMCYR